MGSKSKWVIYHSTYTSCDWGPIGKKIYFKLKVCKSTKRTSLQIKDNIMRRKMKYERVDITNYLFFPSTLWTVSRSTFNLAFQFSSMGSTLSITFLSGKIHLHTTKDDTCRPVNINAIFLNKICWLLACNIFCAQSNINNTTILRTNVKLHHASPLPYLNSTKYLAKFHQLFHLFKRVWH